MVYLIFISRPRVLGDPLADLPDSFCYTTFYLKWALGKFGVFGSLPRAGWLRSKKERPCLGKNRGLQWIQIHL